MLRSDRAVAVLLAIGALDFIAFLSGCGPRTATFLAVLGTLGALYEYLAMLNYSVHLTPVCLWLA